MSPQPVSKKGRGPWLVMLYLAGDTNLTDDMVLALQSLADEGLAPGDRVVAQLDPSGTGLATSRFDLTKAKANQAGPKRAGVSPAMQRRLDEFRAAVPGGHADQLTPGASIVVGGGDVVSSAPELARLFG